MQALSLCDCSLGDTLQKERNGWAVDHRLILHTYIASCIAHSVSILWVVGVHTIIAGAASENARERERTFDLQPGESAPLGGRGRAVSARGLF